MDKSIFNTIKSKVKGATGKTVAVVSGAYLAAGQAVAQTTGRYQGDIQAAGDAAQADAALSGGLVVVVLGTIFGLGALVYLAKKI